MDKTQRDVQLLVSLLALEVKRLNASHYRTLEWLPQTIKKQHWFSIEPQNEIIRKVFLSPHIGFYFVLYLEQGSATYGPPSKIIRSAPLYIL